MRNNPHFKTLYNEIKGGLIWHYTHGKTAKTYYVAINIQLHTFKIMEQINKGINLRILTGREIEYLSLIAMGFKNNQIGYILIVSENTVKKTLGNIFKKIKAKDRANAVALGFINNILTKEIIDNTKEKFFIEGWEEEIEREKGKIEK